MTFIARSAALVSSIFLLALVGCNMPPSPAPSAPVVGIAPENPRCEYLVNPLGVDEPAPRLSWTVVSKERCQRQSAYQVVVSTDPASLEAGKNILWDSGKVLSDNTTAIVYAGKPIESGRRCYWRVMVWDKDGRPSDWSAPAMWSAGLKPEDWSAQWIGYDKVRGPGTLPAPFEHAQWIWCAADKGPEVPACKRHFAATMTIPGDAIITNAQLLSAAGGRIWFNINGAQTQMSHSSIKGMARMVDVTELVKPGKNDMRVQVENVNPGPAGLIAKLTITTRDGKTQTLVTDSAWRSTDKPGKDWQTRKLGPSEWAPCRVAGKAGDQPWGELQYTPFNLPPPSYLRGGFAISKPIKHATVYATALGNFDLHINGRPVSADRFNPGWTDYAKRVYYRAYDIGAFLRQGQNAWGAILADGWFSGFIGWGQTRNHYGRLPRFRAQLHVDYADGSTDVFSTGPEWRASDGPIRQADFLMGETFDARMANDAWAKPEFDSAGWEPVEVGSSEVSPIVQTHPGPPVTVFAELKPVGKSEPKKGVYVFDMGQNFAGVVRLKVSGDPGQKIVLRFAERLNPDGAIYTTNLRGARATDTYICRGGGVETWTPRFTFHGFQYVEITGLKNPPSMDTITGLALSSDTPVAGQFTCSDPTLNRLHKNCYWTQRANFIDVPTDCPQRDERLGWMGDAQVYIRAATLNTDVQSFFTKWLVDVDDGQRADGQFPKVAPVKVTDNDGGPAWADAGVICPWTIYEVYGDKRILAKHYDAMVRFIEFCKNRSTPDLLPPKTYHCYGDWLGINAPTPKDVIYTAYFAHSARLVARAAEILGKQTDAAHYNELFLKIKAAFNRAYVDSNGRIEGDTQACYVLAIAFDLLDPRIERLAADHLVENIKSRDWHLSTGFIGTKDLMLALAKIGRNDVAFRLVHNDTFPSWGFSIKHGATSIWERWDGWTPENGFQTPGMNSFAHYSFGAVYQWMAETIGGIKTDTAGYTHLVIAPESGDRLTSATTAYNSIHGEIKTSWEKKDGVFTLDVTIPANTTATVHVPAADAKNITESGKPAAIASGVRFLRHENGRALFEIGSGHYRFAGK